MDQGWVKLHRQLMKNKLLMKHPQYFQVFLTFLLLADHKTGEIRGGRNELAHLLHMHPSSFYRTTRRLEKESMLNIKSNKEYTSYFICKWTLYQGAPEQQPEHNPNSTRTAPEHSNKKENKKKNIYSDFEELEPELTEFVKMRKLIKSPMTPLAIERLVASVRRMYPDDVDKQRACLLQSVDKGWKGVFELKQEAVVARKSTDRWL